MKNNSVKTIRVKASGEYDVIIGRNLLASTGEYVKKVVNCTNLALITDDKVDALYADKVICSLKENGFEVKKFVFVHGEASKNLSTYGEILDFLAKNHITRTDALIALGGGVVGDMAGFAAATYLRGIKYIQIPTTLLSQIDSSVGGKTAIDLSAGKNLVGAFCQPALVLCDVDALSSLPKEIYFDGMGETAKYAILDKQIFQLIKDGNYQLEQLIALCVDYKRRIVEEDEFESGKRKLLNLGHTPAHGIEKLSDYEISHGQAVAMGLNIILANSYYHGYIDKELLSDMQEVIKKCANAKSCPFSIEDVCEVALSDKKRSGNTISLMMVHGVGDVREHKIHVSELKGYIK